MKNIKKCELPGAFSCFCFCCLWMCFNFCIYFIGWYCCRYWEFCIRIKDLCKRCRNWRVFKWIIKKKRKKHDSIVLFPKTKLITIEALIFKDLIDSCINNEEFVLVNNVWREFSKIKESIKNPENAIECTI